ncbi:hypothetical protein A3D88_03610 [Candidatus Peribacteria bacterium RIFCSPHIGHO2_02_FULL_52_16]|nr:MAG: hypothetical protein A2706_04425 [Candidatus Peribacteria bacterium RIFCSPHIGHO2_01_FULL_51_35]OGJ61770.1 MAG: hypothetical protein A3D88_03610 [Candidatus Peribacteria bacterium RIFCSPHIGHO2_02_FULL_52_16]
MGEVPEAKTEQNSSPPASEAPKDVQAEMKREIEEKNEGEKATEHANDAMRGVQKAANEKGDKMMDGLEKAMKSLETFFAKLSSRLEQFGSGMLKKVAAMLPNPLLNGFLLDIAKKPGAQIAYTDKLLQEKGLTLKLGEGVKANDPDAVQKDTEPHLVEMNRIANAIQTRRGSVYEFEQMVDNAIGMDKNKKDYTWKDLADASQKYFDTVVSKEPTATAPAAAPTAAPALLGVPGMAKDKPNAITDVPLKLKIGEKQVELSRNGDKNSLVIDGNKYALAYADGTIVDMTLTASGEKPEEVKLQIVPDGKVNYMIKFKDIFDAQDALKTAPDTPVAGFEKLRLKKVE